MDENRELRAMLLSVLHLPPLPVTVDLVDRDNHRILNDQHTESSHSIICNLIEWMAIMNSSEVNSKRMLTQMALQQQFHSELRAMETGASDEALYSFLCHHTRLWLNSYTPQGDTIRFKPMDSVTTGDPVHAALLDYAKAQYHHFKEGNETLTIEHKLPFMAIMRKCIEWSKEWNADNTAVDARELFAPTDGECAEGVYSENGSAPPDSEVD